MVMYDTSGKPVARYHLENAWPTKLEPGALRLVADTNSTALNPQPFPPLP